MSLWAREQARGERGGGKPGASLPQRPLRADTQIKRFNWSQTIVRSQNLTYLPLLQIPKKSFPPFQIACQKGRN